MAVSVKRRLLTASGLVVLALAGPIGAGVAATQTPERITAPALPVAGALSESDSINIRAALEAARTGDAGRIRTAMASISDPTGRKIALWAMVDSAPDQVSFFEADTARRDLAGWPRAGARQAAAERLLETAGMGPDRIIAWFGGAQPETPEGAMALAGALIASDRQKEGADLIRSWWRYRIFELTQQRTMRARYGTYLTADDHRVRADLLLYGTQGPATRDMVDMLMGPDKDLAEARMALRAGRSDANALVGALSDDQRRDPGLILEQAIFFHKRGLTNLAYGLSPGFRAAPTEEAAIKVWPERRRMIIAAIQTGDHRAAYNIARDTGTKVGADAAEAEFFAGWLALSKLNDPQAAVRHFAILANAGTSPITRGRALYWQGRAAEAVGETAIAQTFYSQGAEHITVFYGQLAAERAGIKEIRLGKDPVITQADRARFDGREVVRAARILNSIGARDHFRVFVLAIDDILPTAAEAALLVDMARATGDQDLGMRAVRTAAQRGFILPERGYPLITPPQVPGGAEPAFVLSITRQESNFDPRARSGADARGMMQLLPATGRSTARSLGLPYSVERLYEPEFNMQLGARYLGDMVSTFGGSYAMAAAGYNAGPGRPARWINVCGDPRGGTTDPLDFVECIPFSETRNYVMRTLETTQVYRARLNGGAAPLQLSRDLKRGGYSYPTEGPSSGM